MPVARSGLQRLTGGTGTGVQFEVRCLRADRTEVVAATTASVVCDAAGAPARLSINLLDITQRRAADTERRARREAEVARTAAERASQAKSEFLSSFSHELRTPVQAITGFTELLENPRLPAGRRTTALRHISGAAAHVLSLVEDVLDIAKVEARALPLHIEPVPLRQLADEVVDLLEPLATDRGIAVHRPRVDGRASADPRRVRQVLLNLVNNAVRYNRRRVGAGRGDP